MTTSFRGPLRTGTVREGASANAGFVVLSQTNTLAYTDTTAKDLFTLPSGSQIVDIDIDVTTAFNGSTTDVVDVGKSGAANQFVNDADVSSTGRKGGTQQLANWADIGTSDVTVQGIYVDASGDATAGAAQITVRYVQKNNTTASV